ncbi:MAG: hypothetical protein SGCHY_003040 [Lobulomycetales sp.]
MDFKKQIESLDKQLSEYQFLVSFEQKTKVKHAKVFLATFGALIFAITLFFHQYAAFTSNVFAILFPMSKLADALSAKSSGKLSTLAVFYALLASWMTFELTYVLQYRVPFYWFVKCAGVYWLSSDQFYGIQTVAELIKPKLIGLYKSGGSPAAPGPESAAKEE